MASSGATILQLPGIQDLFPAFPANYEAATMFNLAQSLIAKRCSQQTRRTYSGMLEDCCGCLAVRLLVVYRIIYISPTCGIS